ncbi:response regulator [Metallumcola ferriviriculae]|uniref:Stage 0 sporulation protein A homolog n=1 Tax=Metallumcola ferriviriculae TaxID=3039180 RepID=A0AAU0UTB5_9FIRM|nr:response regulator [Desulfitibacteraceae bacterium MK1]
MSKAVALVVDDQVGVRTLLSLLCQEEGMDVRTAGNGLEAINQIKEQLPLVVVMDIRMPIMDGVQALEWINEKHPQIPVILMTAYSAQDKLDKAEAIGATDIWFKPFDIDVVRQKLREFIHIRKQSLA